MNACFSGMQLGSKHLLGLAGALVVGLGAGTWIGFGSNTPARVSPPFLERYRSDIVDVGTYLKSDLRENTNAGVKDVSRHISSQRDSRLDVFSRDYILALNPDRNAWIDYGSDRSTDKIVAVLLPSSIDSQRQDEMILLQQNKWTHRGKFDGAKLVNSAPWLYQGIRYGHEGEQFTFK